MAQPVNTNDPTPELDLDLDPIQERLNDASDGPWLTGYGYEPGWQPWELIISATYPILEFPNNEQGISDAWFIAHARQDIPALIAEVKRLRGELIRETHGHTPGEGQCEKYRCAYCRYCGQEKPCSCYTADGRFRGFSIALPSPDPLKKDFIEGALISAISTIPMFDADGYETAVGLPLGGFEGTGQWHPVERYTTVEEAIAGHARWLALAPTLTEVTDLGNPSDPDSTPTVVDLVAELARLKLKKGS